MVSRWIIINLHVEHTQAPHVMKVTATTPPDHDVDCLNLRSFEVGARYCDLCKTNGEEKERNYNFYQEDAQGMEI